MSPTVQRRGFLTALGAGIASLSGCIGNLPGSGGDVDRTIYVRAYHWGFVMFDDAGGDLDRVTYGEATSSVSLRSTPARVGMSNTFLQLSETPFPTQTGYEGWAARTDAVSMALSIEVGYELARHVLDSDLPTSN